LFRWEGEKLKEIFEREGLSAADVDYFLPHMSSEYFRSKISDVMAVLGSYIPYEKWFVNLTSLGNVGCCVSLFYGA
jgi:3-oxoacyl-[acyl-carrier-protein] synthase-3